MWRFFLPLCFVGGGILILRRHYIFRQRYIDPDSFSREITLPIKNVEEMHLNIQKHGGFLRIYTHDFPDEVLSGQFDYGVDCYAHRDETEEETLYVDLRPLTPNAIPNWEKNQTDTWSIGVNPNIPVTLNLDISGTKATLNLHDLLLSELRLHSGSPRFEAKLPIHAGHTEVRLEEDVLAAKLFVPEGVAAHIRCRQGIEHLNAVDCSRFPQIGRVYESEDYDEAINKVDIHINTPTPDITIL